MLTLQLPDIDVPWMELEDNAADMAMRAATAAGYLGDASAAWTRFHGCYRHPGTQDQVHAAVEELKEPMENWQRSLRDAAETISGFAASGRILAARARELHQVFGQLSQTTETDNENEQQNAAEQQLKEDAAALKREWTDLQQTTAATLADISYGNGAGLPMGAVPGGRVLPAVAWPTLTGRLDERFGTLDPQALLPSLAGLDDAELREWAAANPEAAALLAGRALTGPFLAGTAEALMQKAMANGADLAEDGVAGIRTTWLGLSPQDQERLMLLYPAVFGNLNGVPFTQRAKANLITVPGLQHTVREQLAQLREPVLDDYPQNTRNSYYSWKTEHEKWLKLRGPLEKILRGLDHAVDQNIQVVMVNTEGNGQIVTMTGTPSRKTKYLAALVPGSGANLGELRSYSDRFAAVYGEPSDKKVGFYWQGTDLPQDVVWDNRNSDFNESGAPRLAAFDFAVDLEIPSDARTTYVGYSAGGSLLGTGEREGLDSTNIVYVAPAGPGHGVGGVEDTANPAANRYWLQARDDVLIGSAQKVGGGGHGKSFLRSGTPTVMGVTRLETGFIDPADPRSVVTGHEEYFVPGSTSAMNLTGVIEGTWVSPFVEYVTHWEIEYSYRESPIESRPEDFTGGKLKLVDVKTLEEQP